MSPKHTAWHGGSGDRSADQKGARALCPWVLTCAPPSLQFLAYDTQLVLGNRKHTISPEDYITGALQIYTDIIYIFTFVLQLVGSRD